MSWNNRNYDNWGNRGSYPNNRRNYGGNNRQKKHSGCRLKIIDGKPFLSAWNYSRSRGMVSMYARPYTKTRLIESQKGKQWLNLFVTITHKQTMQVVKTSGMYDVERKRLYLKEFNMVASASTNYFGVHLQKR